MARLSLALLATLAAGASGFVAPTPKAATSVTQLNAEQVWDPLSLSKLKESCEEQDVFYNMFPHEQFLKEAEVKHGRMCMLAWTGVWATHVGGMGLGMHIPGFPVEPDWTKALGVFAAEQPAWFAGILLFISACEGESVGHAGDNFRGVSTKEPGNLGFDPWGLTKKLSDEKQAKYKDSELKNGRAAMIAMASLFAFESIPGSVPLMDLFGAQ
jgi:hypothetical protein